MSKKLQSKNKIIVASAGGRKTTYIVEEALKQKNRKVLITTYTLENLDQISSFIIGKNGYIPENITILSWFTFLLRDGVWPYQNYVLANRNTESIDYVTQSTPRIRGGRSNPSWYLNRGNYMYKDRVSEFVCDCNAKNSGLTIKRLEDVYDSVYIDEMQDLVGWDQEFIELLMQSSVEVTLVGDPRQSTYSTNYSIKNKSKKGRNMLNWIEDLESIGLCVFEEKIDCYRCNQHICNFGDELYPKLTKTKSKNTNKLDISIFDSPKYRSLKEGDYKKIDLSKLNIGNKDPFAGF